MNTVTMGTHPTIQFASKELIRYLKLAGVDKGMPDLTVRIGLVRDLGIEMPIDVAQEDDWICVRQESGGYILSGANPRSVLFAVYRFLHELGFRWIRPGKRGEIIPVIGTSFPEISTIEEKPSCRYRTICIEGVCSFEHVRDLIDWAAKHGMNGFFLQFEYGWYFWRRWYEHEGNTHWPGKPFNLSDAERVANKVILELKKRSLSFERVGHGWTTAVLGINGEGWDKNTDPLPADKMNWLAEVDGKREFSGGIPINTNLCYGNAEVRAALVNVVFEYARDHREVDVLHFWLGDGMNNNCECPLCVKELPSDFYVQMLNDLDERLSAAAVQTKIVFLIYVDLLWPPLSQKLTNPERFILMLAPITRSFIQPLADVETPRIPDFNRNKLQMPSSAEENIAFLKAWRPLFRGGAFDFDYHLLWSCYYDPNQYTLASVLHTDIQNFADLNLQGLNSCQVQRHGFPNNLLQDVMARTLWNKDLSFDMIAETSFSDAYGFDSPQVSAFFREMSRLWLPFFEPVFTHKFSEDRVALCRANLDRVCLVVDNFRPLLERHVRKHPSSAVRQSWRYLGLYLELLGLLLPAFGGYLSRSSDCRLKFDIVFEFLWKNERVLHPVLDVFTFVMILKWRVDEAETLAAHALAGAVS